MIGFEKIYKNLSKAKDFNRLHHAIVISGNRGVGKFDFAKSLAIEILTGKDDKSQKDHPDLRIIEKITGKKNVSVEQVRSIAGFFQSTSATSNKKVVIVNAADDFNISSSNALLKTLEEPNKNCHLILICHSLSKLLPTIKSRCQIHKIEDLSFDKFKEAFYKLRPEFLPKLSEEEIETLSLLTAGSPKMAFRIGEDLTLLYNGILKSLSDDFLDQELLKKVNEKSFELENLITIFDIIYNRLIKFNCTIDDKFSENEERIFTKISQNKSIDDIFKSYEKSKSLLLSTMSINLDKKLSVVNCFNLMQG